MIDEVRRITITLTPEERDALALLALRERRDTRRQAAILVTAELERLGLLPAGETQKGAE